MSHGRRGVGRPEVTTHEDIELAAFRLFAEHGFEGTTLDMIAAEVGVGRRTLFRYFPSKNDIAWGRFDATLDHFRSLLAALPDDLDPNEAVLRGVLAFNDFSPGGPIDHRDRMRLILYTPALQAHSVLRYGDWRQVIADFVAVRTGEPAGSIGPQLVSHLALARALCAYEQWLAAGDAELLEILRVVLFRSHA
ncbi:mycofactocin system transcriptional regulator [Nocardioides sp. WS12]|uniref:mycofactocin system transcriptional regulator n=1 Tax=Nocardioides sp. WS12 TaxID=2486272 RepID=UPI0015F8CF5E|nr:mycofactocin system transcriptional regulator [Nocardioides sp. WS12]